MGSIIECNHKRDLMLVTVCIVPVDVVFVKYLAQLAILIHMVSQSVECFHSYFVQ